MLLNRAVIVSSLVLILVHSDESFAGRQIKQQDAVQHQAKRTRVLKHPPAKLACNNCRKRHVKCDEGKPTCGRCAKGKKQCDYGNNPFKWHVEILESIGPQFVGAHGAEWDWHEEDGQQEDSSDEEGEDIGQYAAENCALAETMASNLEPKFSTSATEPPPHQKKPRKRYGKQAKVACAPCRASHGRCDEGRPCGKCSSRRITERCTYEGESTAENGHPRWQWHTESGRNYDSDDNLDEEDNLEGADRYASEGDADEEDDLLPNSASSSNPQPEPTFDQQPSEDLNFMMDFDWEPETMFDQ